MNLLNIINYLSSNGGECRMLIRLCRLPLSLLFFVMKREKTIWFDTPGDFFPSLLVKENYSLHSLREKSIIPNKSQSCCPPSFFFFPQLCPAGPEATLILCHMLCCASLSGVTLAVRRADSCCYLSRCRQNVMERCCCCCCCCRNCLILSHQLLRIIRHIYQPPGPLY